MHCKLDQESLIKTNQCSSIFIYFWPRWETQFIRPPLTIKVLDKICETMVLTWDIRKHRTVITDRREVNEVSNTIAPHYFLRRFPGSSTWRGCKGRIWDLLPSWEGRFGVQRVQGSSGSQKSENRRELCESCREGQNVPLESSAGVAQCPCVMELTKTRGRTMPKAEKGTTLRVHSVPVFPPAE